jgi:hypothetical protein
MRLCVQHPGYHTQSESIPAVLAFAAEREQLFKLRPGFRVLSDCLREVHPLAGVIRGIYCAQRGLNGSLLVDGLGGRLRGNFQCGSSKCLSTGGLA